MAEKRTFLTNDVLAFLIGITTLSLTGGRTKAIIRFYYGYSNEEIDSMPQDERLLVMADCRDRILKHFPGLKNIDINKARGIVFSSQSECVSQVFADLKSYLRRTHNLRTDYFQYSVELVR